MDKIKQVIGALEVPEQYGRLRFFENEILRWKYSPARREMIDGERLEDKTFRVFASKRDTDGMIYKVKTEGGKGEKFANTPDRCFIDNTEVTGKSVPEYLDKEWYIDLAEKRIERFTKGD